MKFLITLIFSFGSLLCSSVWADQKIFVRETVGNSVESSEKETVSELIRSAVMEIGGWELVDSASNSAITLSSKLVRLKQSYILIVNKSNSKTKKNIFSSRLKAASFDDMDSIVPRVVKSVIQESSAKRSAEVDTVTESEVNDGSRRYQATSQKLFRFAAAWPQNMNSNRSAWQVAGGYLWGVDPQFDLGLLADFTFGQEHSDMRFVNFMINMQYYINKSKHAPYLIGGLGYGHASVHSKNCNTVLCTSDDTASGLALTGGVGFRFFRTSSVNLAVDLKYETITKNATTGRPGYTTLGLSVFF